ncbi:MAG: hypothetical protein QM479_08080 [Pseudomonadota bacterium]
MLNSLKAISLGFTCIVLLGLLNQLIFIMASVAYNYLLHSFPELIQWEQLFIYATGAICFFIVMASAGFITAMASVKHSCIHSAIAALLGMSFSLYYSLQQEIFTLFALLFVLIGLTFSLIGCHRWVKQSAAA